MNITNSKNSIFISRILIISILFGVLTSAEFSIAADEESITLVRQMGKAFATVAEKASPAVVAVSSTTTIESRYRDRLSPYGVPLDELLEFFMEGQPQQPQRNQQPEIPRQRTDQGSGFIISSEGYILTNNHVVEGADKVEIELTDGRNFEAEIIGADEDSDIAVVKIEAFNLPFLELADSDELEVGEWVLAIGNPLGLSHTVTAGIVSAVGRSGFGLAQLENFIQTDAAINFGNSGGPLINLDGKAVGMNSAIAGVTGNIGIGFAIPINMVKYAYEQIVENGNVEWGLLGIDGIETLTPNDAPSYGLDENAKGVIFQEVIKESAADKAGLTDHDVILEVNGVPVETTDALISKISTLRPGTKVEVTIWRDNKKQKLTVELGSRSSITELVSNILGFTVENLNSEIAELYGYQDKAGVVVTWVGPNLSGYSDILTVGTLIKEVNDQPITNVQEFNEAIEVSQRRGIARLTVENNNADSYVNIILPRR